MRFGAIGILRSRRHKVVNQYLFLAYTFVWALFMFYAWNLSRGQAKLKRDIESLQRQISGQPNSGQPQA